MTRLAGRSATSQRLGLLAVLVLLLGLVLPLAPAAEATHALGTAQDVDSDRYAGENRFDTAGLIANDVSGGDAPDVLLARADLFPDTLSGNFLAGVRGDPVLLMPQDFLFEDTMGWLETLGTENITILGGTEAISAGNEEALEDEGYNVDRIGGENRFETAQLIAEQAADEGAVGTWEGERTAIVASGENFPDALVSGALGFSESFPVLLTNTDFLTDFTEQALDNLNIERVIIPGGSAAVSLNAEGDIQDMGIDTTRVNGRTRVTTATEFADFVQTEFGWPYALINIARGDLFPDALTIGPLAGSAEAPLLLTYDPNTLGGSTLANGEMETEPWLRAHACEIRGLHFAGGVKAITADTADEAEAAAEDCDEPVEEPEPEPEPAAVAALNAEHIGSDVNQVGDAHHVQVTATDGDGDDAAGINVRFEVTRDGTATGTPSSDDDETNANGQAVFTYTNDTAGEDTITVCANEDGSLPADCGEADLDTTVTKTWTTEEPLVADDVDATPKSETNIVGDSHTVDATVTDQNGALLSGASVRFEIESGPNVTLEGEDTSDSNGHADFTYVGDEGVGTDTILVYADLNGNDDFDDGEPFDEVTKTWEIGEPDSLLLLPEDETNPVGTDHTMFAIVRDANGNPVSGTIVRFEVTGTVFTTTEDGTDTTDNEGVATFTYSRDSAGEDDITACANENQTEPTPTCATRTEPGPEDTAEKTWEERIPTTLDLQPEGEDNEVTNDPGGHEVVATVRDQFGAPVEGAMVLFQVTDTTTASPPQGTDDTDENGQAIFTYSNDTAGVDRIAACTTESGAAPAECAFEPVAAEDGDLEDTVEKTWVSTPEELDLLGDEEATNTVGEQHQVTASVTDGAGQPVAGATVRFEVDDTLMDEIDTNSSGHAVFQYSTTTAGDDTIEACTTEDGTTPEDCPTEDHLTDTQIKHWVTGAAASLDLSPEEATNTVGEDHTVTALVLDEFGNPVSGTDVFFEVHSSGNPAPASGTATTSSDGTATFTYSNDTAGDDRVEACLTSGSCTDEAVTENDNEDLVDAVNKHWTASADELAFSVGEAANTVGTSHEATVTVRDQADQPVENAPVRFEVDGVHAGNDFTDSNGVASVTYTGPDSAQDDEIVACTTEGGTIPADCPTTTELTDTQIKHWVADDPNSLDLIEEETTNTVNEQHTVTATVTDQHGNAVQGAEVLFEVTNTVGEVIQDTRMTDENGQVTFTYDGPSTPEDHIIAACTTADGTAPDETPDNDCPPEAPEDDAADAFVDRVIKHWTSA